MKNVAILLKTSQCKACVAVEKLLQELKADYISYSMEDDDVLITYGHMVQSIPTLVINREDRPITIIGYSKPEIEKAFSNG